MVQELFRLSGVHMCSHVLSAHPTGQRASRSPAPALGPPVKVIGDAPAQKATLGGTMPDKEEPWHLSEHRERAGTGRC